MTPAELIAAFDVLADAPDGVKRLRELVLSLAVRGKLVEQDPAEEPAPPSAVHTAGLKNDTLWTLSNTNDLPASWSVVPMANLGQWGSGGTPLKGHPEYYDGAIPWLKIGDLNDGLVTSAETRISDEGLSNSAAKMIPAGTVLIGMYGSIGKSGITAISCCTNQAIAHCIPDPRLVVVHYLFRLVGAMRQDLESKGRGAAQQNISQTVLRHLMVPLPPLAEQYRIVTRVDELMALLDKLEGARKARDEVRRAARDAALAALRDAPDAEAVEVAWGRVSDAMDELFVEPEDVEPLRQAVLELAVRGRLVEQDPDEEPISRTLGHRVVSATHPPFPLPEGWSWSSIEQLGEVLGGGTPSKANPRFWSGSIPWVSPKDMKVARLTDSQDHVSPEAVEASSVKLVPRGSLLMVVRGMILVHSFPVALTEVEVTVNQDMKVLVPFASELTNYLLLLLHGSKPRVLALVERSTHGTCKLPYQSLAKLPLALPPLGEQRRIVAKVDALMAICDTLAARLTAARDLHGQFAAAAVHHFDV